MPRDASVRKLGLQALFDLKGGIEDVRRHLGALAADIPLTPNTVAASEGRLIYHVGPDHWLLRAPGEREAELIAAIRPESAPEALSVVPISDSLSFFEIAGNRAEDVLSIATPLDIHPRAFPSDGATFTEAFGVKALVARRQGAGAGFEMAFDRSHEDMVREYFRRILA